MAARWLRILLLLPLALALLAADDRPGPRRIGPGTLSDGEADDGEDSPGRIRRVPGGRGSPDGGTPGGPPAGTPGAGTPDGSPFGRDPHPPRDPRAPRPPRSTGTPGTTPTVESSDPGIRLLEGPSTSDPGSFAGPGIGWADAEPGQVLVLSARTGVAGLSASGIGGLVLLREHRLPALERTLRVYEMPPATPASQALQAIRRIEPGAIVDRNGHFGLLASPSDGPRRYAAGLVRWGAAEPSCGSGIKLGLIDTGIDPRHPALANRAIEVRSFLESGARASAADHATAIAGILVGDPRADGYGGLLPGAELSVAAVFSETQRGPNASAERVTRALDWLVGRGTPVINLSFGGSENQVLREAVRLARGAGTVIVAAAGNGGPNAAPVHPAADPEVIAVGAVDALMAPYSHGNRGSYLDLAAPGVDLWVARPGGRGTYKSGTSFASPFAAAAAAWERRSAATGDVLASLKAASRDLGEPGPDPVFGAGLVQATPRCARGVE